MCLPRSANRTLHLDRDGTTIGTRSGTLADTGLSMTTTTSNVYTGGLNATNGLQGYVTATIYLRDKVTDAEVTSLLTSLAPLKP